MTMILTTGVAVTRERESGTFENLLSTPALPLEVMTGKIIPYILIRLIQVTFLPAAALLIFKVPMQRSIILLYASVSIFIASNLTLGITFSSIARNQLQAMQMTFFFFLPSILLFGFHVPFSRHARVGTVGGFGPVTNPFSKDRARDHAQGKNFYRDLAEYLAGPDIHGGRYRSRVGCLSQNAGLKYD